MKTLSNASKEMRLYAWLETRKGGKAVASSDSQPFVEGPRLNGHESEQTPGESEGQRSLVCCRAWGHKELDTT